MVDRPLTVTERPHLWLFADPLHGARRDGHDDGDVLNVHWTVRHHPVGLVSAAVDRLKASLDEVGLPK